MPDNSNQRNSFASACLWFGILGYTIISISYIVTMYEEHLPNKVLGLGLCSMLTLVNTLGVLLILRWSKNGFYLLVISAILSAVVNLSVLRLELLPSAFFLIASAIWLVILQLKSGGKSVWDQLRNGWDSKHCRHIYQLFSVVEIILFVLTLLAFGSKSEDTTDSHAQIEEPVNTKPQNRPTIKKPTEDIDSIQESPIVSPAHDELKPIESEKKPIKKLEKPSKDSAKDGKNAKDDKTKDSLYDLNAAVKYLDTHDVWNTKEMERYPDLKDLNKRIIESIRIGHSMIPRELCHKSKRLSQIDHLLHQYDCIRIKQNSKLYPKVRIEYDESSDKISPRKVIMRIKAAIERKQNVKREIDAYEKLVSDEAKNAEPSFELR